MADRSLRAEWRSYVVALVCSGLAIASVALFTRLTFHEFTLMPLIIAVLVSAWHGGLRPGLVATGLTVASAAFVFIEPIGSLYADPAPEQVRLALLAGISIAISFLCESLHRYRRDAERVAAALRQNQAALEEQVERYRRSERLYRAVGESINYGVWICDPGGQNIYASESFLKLVGMTQEECSSFGWGNVLHPDDAEETIRAWKACARAGTFWEREHRFRGVDGQWHHILARGVPIRDDAGRIACWAGINLDISTLKQAEERLRDSDKRKDEFLATLSHELRNPLAPLRTALYVIRTGAEDPGITARALDTMDRQLRHLVRLVDDLLDMSRISSGRIELRRQPAPIDHIVASAIEASTPLIDTSGHRLVVDLADPPGWVDADAARIAQALANILNNAAKYTPDGGTIRLSTEVLEGRVFVRCRDDGIGMTAEMLPHIFDAFRRTSGSSSGGLGLGLAVVRRLVELHGGTVEARSEGPGLGSEVSVSLPATAPVVQVDRMPQAVTSLPAVRRRVLVVDDNRDSAEMMQTLLTVLGHEPAVAFDGTSGIEAAVRDAPDVVLLDIGLPDMSGYDVARRLRSEPALGGMTLIALTGWGQPEDRARAKEAGFDHHLTKPADPDTLAGLLAGPSTGHQLA